MRQPKLILAWPRLMDAETAAEYVCGQGRLKLLLERGLKPSIAETKLTTYDRDAIDAIVDMISIEAGVFTKD